MLEPPERVCNVPLGLSDAIKGSDEPNRYCDRDCPKNEHEAKFSKAEISHCSSINTAAPNEAVE